jgi:hypothetical protein
MVEFAGLPKRKLDDLAARGWQVCGVAIAKEGQYGAITYGGCVLWWVSRDHGISESPFDYDTAKRLLAGESIGEDQLKAFVANARWSNDDVKLLRGELLEANLMLAQRDAEIELLKAALLDAEAA